MTIIHAGIGIRRRCKRDADKHVSVKLVALMFSLAVACQSITAVAQVTAPINAERPGFSSSPIALAPSLLQIESGYQYTRDGGTEDFSLHYS